MYIRALPFLLVGFLLGFAVRSLWPTEPDVSDHWRKVNEYRDLLDDPSNLVRTKINGKSFLAIEDPPDPLPSLAALVAAGELKHWDIVLPTISAQNRQANQLWMQIGDKHGGIVHATGNPQYTSVPIKGRQPLHLNIWFKPAASPAVEQLISDLEALGDGEPASWPSAPAPW
jgi:hypothetical protein